ncbi:M48 family metalloprotease [Sulfidibacter corallicola]|uniref:M48 family metalloprotease n=1 Tax=Sulfidibacter corallicola TaxID=2818388 RepID=A0A8A4TUC5_SULCO|nr:M48 family metalloprotease [Sulfidibacter corallicola]QTD53120.1 M48 family metalloprotease [Sulfidibacter corallicola]
MTEAYVVSPHSIAGARSENQDCFAHFETPYGSLFIVCDGFGGPRRGRLASMETVEAYPEHLKQAHGHGMMALEALQWATAEINERIFEKSTSGLTEFEGMGTTVVLGLETEAGIWIGHIGDSRAYHWTGSQLVPLTRDHSELADLIYSGDLNVAGALHHPRAGVLTQAIGAEEDGALELAKQPIRLRAGESLMLCSDGLSGFVEDEVIAGEMAQITDQGQAARHLVRLALAHGSDDNITVLCIHNPGSKKRRKSALPHIDTTPDDTSTSPSWNDSDSFIASQVQARGSRAASSGSHPSAHPSPEPGDAGRVTTVSAKRAEPIAEEKPKWRIPLWVYPTALLVAMIFTALHFRNMVQIKPYVPPPEPETIAGEPPTEVDDPKSYPWQVTECERGFATQARQMLGDVEQGFRDSATMALSRELELGERLAKRAAQEYAGRLDTDANLVAYVNKLGTSLAADLGDHPYTFEFHVIDDERLNAFALPGGHIYLFTGLLEHLVENEAQLAFVLCHEMVHIQKRHTVALLRLFENLPGEEDGVTAFFQSLLNLPFSITHEAEADRYALLTLIRADYSPYQSVLLLEKWQRRNQGTASQNPSSSSNILDVLLREAGDLLETHPDLDFRACELRNHTLQLQKQNRTSLNYVGQSNYRNRIPKSELMY